MYVEGRILAGPDYEPVEGRVHVKDGQITAIEECAVESRDIVAPAFVNAHTHIGDSVAKDAAVGLGLQEAVAPPESLKHRRLAAADRSTLIDSMSRTIQYMEGGGTAAFLDFRENGAAGAEALQTAAEGHRPSAFVFGSDDPSVLRVADGYGASGANDADFTDERAAAAEADAPFAIHAGEPDPTDIHPALDLEPDLLVHMIHANSDHLERVADQSVPIAVCPRANAALDVGAVSLSALIDHTTVALGTDNVMLAAPNMFREMAYTARTFDVSDTEVLRMATRAGAAIAGFEFGLIEVGRPAKLIVLDGDSHNLAGCSFPRRAVVRRAGPSDVRRVIG